jgi:hypothetical protein
VSKLPLVASIKPANKHKAMSRDFFDINFIMSDDVETPCQRCPSMLA